MPTWLRYTLLVIVMVASATIGLRVYLERAKPASEQMAVRTGAVEAPDRLPDFSLRDLNGETRSIGEWANQPLLINFWATWCAPCRREMPLLQTLHMERAQTGLQILGIAIDRQADVQSYITESGISYPILWGEGDAIEVTDLLGVPELGLPFTVLVDHDGRILTIYVGELVREQLATMASIVGEIAAGDMDVATARERLGRL
jgi:peroxiredoxin